MTLISRAYDLTRDYHRVSEFLIAHYRPGNMDGNWLEPAWEYMHGHPLLDKAALSKISLWEDDGKIVAVVHYEWGLGEAFFQLNPAYRVLRHEMLDYAEHHLCGISSKDGRKYLASYVNEDDLSFIDLVSNRGYQQHPDGLRPLYRFSIPTPYPPIRLPHGYKLKSLADNPDWIKVNRVLYRGFDNEGEPLTNEEELESRRRMFDTPKGKRELKIVVEAPNGDYASFCGMFLEPTGNYAYVEPVATDPTYRRMGLGKAAVLEGIRRCAELGAKEAYVGSNLEFYQAIGFTKIRNSECWVRYFDGN